MRHNNCVAIGIDRHRGRETLIVKSLHESELLQRSNTRQVKPAVISPPFQVIPVFFNRPKRRPSQPCEFNHNHLPLRIFTHVYIRLFAHADLNRDLLNVPSLHKRFECEVVVPAVCERIPVVLLVHMHHQFVLEQELDDLVSVAALECGQALYEWERDILVVLHAHLDCCEHAEVLFGQVVDQVRV